MAHSNYREGQIVGHFVLLERQPSIVTKSGRANLRWKVRCLICGHETIRDTHNFKRNETETQCRCRNCPDHPDRADGFLSKKQPEYKIWVGIVGRCYNQKNKNYPLYGARGITFHDIWRQSFKTFIDDVGRRPSEQHSLDRIDPYGNYEPGNVRWTTAKEQARNVRKIPHKVKPTDVDRLLSLAGYEQISSEGREQWRTPHGRIVKRSNAWVHVKKKYKHIWMSDKDQ
jgi:hypothetical protein